MYRNAFRPLGLVLVAIVAATALTACNSGSSSSSSSTPAASTSGASMPGAAPSGAPSGLPSDAAAQFAKIQECLDAAGIDLPAPSLPAGASPPAGATPPAGGSFSPPAGGGQLQDNPQVKAALDACGISLPTAPPAGG